MSLLKYLTLTLPILMSSCVSLLTASSGKVVVSDYDSLDKNENVTISYGNHKNTSSDDDFTPLTDSVINNIHRYRGIIYKIEDKNNYTQYILSDMVPNPKRYHEYALSASFLGLGVFSAIKGGAFGKFAGGVLLIPSAVNIWYLHRYLSQANSETTSLNYIPRNCRDKKVDELYLKAGTLSVETNHIDLYEFKTIDHYKNNDTIKDYVRNLENSNIIENQDTILESIISKSGFAEKDAFLPNAEKNIKINASVQSWKGNFISYFTGVIKNELVIEWEFQDVLSEEVLLNLNDTVTTDYMINGGKKFYTSQIRNGLEKSLVEILKRESVSNVLQKENNLSKIYKDPINIVSVDYAESKGESMKSSVTIKNGDRRGSGFIISNNGYIITNYHITGNIDSVQVYLYDGKLKKAKVLRVNKRNDLALLKTDLHNAPHLKINTDTSVYNNLIGREVNVIGTPINSSLGQSISTGIISGKRNFSDVNTIQTNASINPGSSGGPLILDSNEVIGIVNGKLNGAFNEGVGFAIPASSIFKSLNINISYK